MGGAFTHDGLGRAALVRRFKINLKPSHKVPPKLGPSGKEPLSYMAQIWAQVGL
jgi:hypothetical protein